jgi:hypothetical protein
MKKCIICGCTEDHDEVFDMPVSKVTVCKTCGFNVDYRIFAVAAGLSSGFCDQGEMYRKNNLHEHPWVAARIKEVGKPTQSNTQYPHKCELCGSPSWNGLSVDCSNPDCIHG